MEFTYKVSEANYREAWKLRRKTTSRARVIETVFFWVFILVCLLLLWMVVQHNAQRPTALQPQVVEPAAPAASGFDRILRIWPVGFVALWAYLGFWFLPMQVRRLYRKDPLMRGQFAVSITPASIAIKNTAGTSSQSGWDIYDFWREGRSVIILVMHSSAYFILSLAELSEAQRGELRGILAAALPKR